MCNFIFALFQFNSLKWLYSLRKPRKYIHHLNSLDITQYTYVDILHISCRGCLLFAFMTDTSFLISLSDNRDNFLFRLLVSYTFMLFKTSRNLFKLSHFFLIISTPVFLLSFLNLEVIDYIQTSRGCHTSGYQLGQTSTQVITFSLKNKRDNYDFLTENTYYFSDIRRPWLLNQI